MTSAVVKIHIRLSSSSDLHSLRGSNPTVNRKTAIFFATLCLPGAFVACGGGNKQAPMSTSRNFRQSNLIADIAGTAAHTDFSAQSLGGRVRARAGLLDRTFNEYF